MDYILIALLLIGLLFYINRLPSDPTQNEIQTLEYAKDIPEKELIETKDYIYPQISRGFKKLGKEAITKPLDNLSKLLPQNNSELDIIRDTTDNINKKRIHLPEYYRKDRLSGNTLGSEEYRSFKIHNEDPDNSWTDEDVSRYPKYYNSDVQNELTNVGMFFDKNNKYNDKSSSNTEVLVSDGCYVDKLGNQFCEDNTRLQNIPPSLITDVQNCKILNSIGSYKV